MSLKMHHQLMKTCRDRTMFCPYNLFFERETMIEIISFEEPHIIGIRLDGKIDNESFDRAITKIQDALENNQKIRIYAEVVSFGGMSLEKFFENLKVKFEFMGQLEKFEKEAVVSDKQWVDSLVKIGDKFFPGVEVKCFTFDKKDEALAWVKG
jgi:hypothetical protein